MERDQSHYVDQEKTPFNYAPNAALGVIQGRHPALHMEVISNKEPARKSLDSAVCTVTTLKRFVAFAGSRSAAKTVHGTKKVVLSKEMLLESTFISLSNVTSIQLSFVDGDIAAHITPAKKDRPISWKDLPHKGLLAILTMARLSAALTHTSVQSYMF
ncbi:MAG: hypothetical protein LQ347_000764 [Umbilicaria vellea]|nr:MAG: hypothetical protein LQ347_000764 [Umbilicaria vellea]